MPTEQIYILCTPSGWITYTGGKRKTAEDIACHHAAKASMQESNTRMAFVFAKPPFARLKYKGAKDAGRFPINMPRAMAVGVRYFAVDSEGKIEYSGTLTVARTLMLFGRYFSTDSFTAADVARIEREAAKLK